MDQMEVCIAEAPPPKKQKTEHDATLTTATTVTTENAVAISMSQSSSSTGSITSSQPRVPPPRKGPETIDLRAHLSGPVVTKEQQRSLDALLKVFRKKKKIVVVAGAGISVGAGIPDFRSAGGLFSSLRSDHKLKTSGKELFDAAVYRDKELTSSFHDMVRNLDSMVKKATPTAFHHLLASLAKEDRLLRLYSQNVDCIENQLPPLHTQVPLGSKGPWPKTIQLHGGLEKMVCSKCGWLGGFDAELFRGQEPPDCSECVEMESVRGIAGKRSLGVGKLRPRIVLYNEYHPDSEAIGSVSKADLKTRPDAIIVVGTSLKVPGIRRIVREMCKSVQDMRGGVTVWINEDEPPLGKDLEGAFDLIVKGDCEMVAALAALPRWDGSDPPPPISQTATGSCTPEYMELSQFPETSSQMEVQISQTTPPLPPTSQPVTSKKRKAPAGEGKAKKEPAAKKPRAPRKPKAAPKEPKTTLNKAFKVGKTAAPQGGKGSKKLKNVGEVSQLPPTASTMAPPDIPTPPPTDQLSLSPSPQPSTIHVRPEVAV